jgi:hypothetical protein
VLTIQERWWFESIPNQLVIYSSHKPHSPIKWATDHQWHYSDKRHGINWGRSTQGPPDCQESGLFCPWAHSSCPCHTPFSTNTRTRIDPGPNNASSFAVERYFIWPAKCEACVQHDKRDEQRSVFNRHRRKTTSTQNPIWSPPTILSNLQLSINTWLFSGYHPFHN